VAIEYVPASPVAPGVSAAAGAAEQWNKFFPYLQRGNEDTVAQLNRQSQNLGDWYHQQTGILAQQNALQQHAQFQQQAQVQAAQLRDWEQTQQMTKAETDRLYRDQAAMSAVEASSFYTPEEKAQIRFQIQTGIDPLLRKQRQMQMQQQQEQYENTLRQHQQLASIQEQTDEQRTHWFQDADGQPSASGMYVDLQGRAHSITRRLAPRAESLTTPDGQTVPDVYVVHDGRGGVHIVDRGAQANRFNQQNAQAQQRAQEAENRRREAAWQQALTHSDQQMRRELERWETDPGHPGYEPGQHPWYDPVQRQAELHRRARDMFQLLFQRPDLSPPPPQPLNPQQQTQAAVAAMLAGGGM
jgi:hypothetical protein